MVEFHVLSNPIIFENLHRVYVTMQAEYECLRASLGLRGCCALINRINVF